MEIKPCPFCGMILSKVERDDSGLYWIMCLFCNAEGPATSTKKDAADAWNRRA